MLAQIAAAERARDRRFVDGMTRGVPCRPREYRDTAADGVALWAALAAVATVLFGVEPLAVVAGVAGLAAVGLRGRGRPVW
jgi:hypothetical protein